MNMQKPSVALLSLALFLVIGCGHDNAANTTSPEQATITDMSTLTTAADRRKLVGAKVDVPNARAEQVVGTYFFWVGQGHAAVPVVRGDKLKGPVQEHVRAGDTLRITGTVRLLENVPATDPTWDHI